MISFSGRKDAIVILYPIFLDIHTIDDCLVFSIMMDFRKGIHFPDSGIDDQSPAHGTRSDMCQKLMCGPISPSEIQVSTLHVSSGSRDDRICFSMNASAKFISLTRRNLMGLAIAITQLAAVLSTSGSAVVSSCNDFVTILPSQASRSFQYTRRNIEIILCLGNSFFHIISSYV